MSVFRFGRSLVRSFCKHFTDKGKTFQVVVSMIDPSSSICKVVDLLVSKDRERLQQSQASVVVKSERATGLLPGS